LLLDVGQNHHVHALPGAGGALPEGPQAAWADIHHAAQPIDRKGPTLFFDEPKPHGFWLAKNWVAFFRMSLIILAHALLKKGRKWQTRVA